MYGQNKAENKSFRLDFEKSKFIFIVDSPLKATTNENSDVQTFILAL